MKRVLPVPYGWVRPFLFQLDPERSHEMAQQRIRRAGASLRQVERMRERTLPSEAREIIGVDALGLRFDSPVGLAAGFDKGEVLGGGFFAMGFGFVEVGTITPRPQSGNPRPRLFRIKREHALINRMGFNNEGAEVTAARLAQWRALGTRVGPVGINVGKNKDTPLENAADDYLRALESLLEHADYVVVNVSSPNTPGLRELQKPAALRTLLGRVVEACSDVPVLVKIDPDRSLEDVDIACDVTVESGCQGLIATNTTVSRDGLNGARYADESGGLSGRPLTDRACEVLRRAFERAGKEIVLIGVGGIDSVSTAYERIRAGATLIQIYTGMIYRGPSLIERLNAGLAVKLADDGYQRLRDAVGADT